MLRIFLFFSACADLSEALTSADSYAIVLAIAIRDLQVLVNAIYRMRTLFNETLIFLCSGRKCQSGVFHPCDGTGQSYPKERYFVLAKQNNNRTQTKPPNSQNQEASSRLTHGEWIRNTVNFVVLWNVSIKDLWGFVGGICLVGSGICVFSSQPASFGY